MVQEQPAIGCVSWNPPLPPVPACDLSAAGIFTNLLSAGCDITETPTEVTFNGNGSCFQSGGGWWSVSGSLTITLDDEDTRAAAIARLLANTDWSAWGTGCIAQSTAETYVEGEWRIQGTSLTPFQAYEIDVTFWRATSPGGPFTLFQTQTFSGVAAADGTLNFTGATPNQEGFYTEARCDCVFRAL